MKPAQKQMAKYAVFSVLILSTLFVGFINPGYVTDMLDRETETPENEIATQVAWDIYEAKSNTAGDPSAAVLWLNNPNPSPTEDGITGAASSQTVTFKGDFAHGDKYLMKVSFSSNCYTAIYSGELKVKGRVDTTGKALQPSLVAFDKQDGTDVSIAMNHGSTDLDATTDGAAWAVSASTTYAGVDIMLDGSSMSDERWGNTYEDPEGKQYHYKAYIRVTNNNTAATVTFNDLTSPTWGHYTEGTTEYWVAEIPESKFIVNDAAITGDENLHVSIDIELGATQVNKFTIEFFDEVAEAQAQQNNFGTADETEYIYSD